MCSIRLQRKVGVMIRLLIVTYILFFAGCTAHKGITKTVEKKAVDVSITKTENRDSVNISETQTKIWDKSEKDVVKHKTEENNSLQTVYFFDTSKPLLPSGKSPLLYIQTTDSRRQTTEIDIEKIRTDLEFKISEKIRKELETSYNEKTDSVIRLNNQINAKYTAQNKTKYFFTGLLIGVILVMIIKYLPKIIKVFST